MADRQNPQQQKQNQHPGIEQNEYDELDRMHDDLRNRAPSFQGDQRRDFDDVDRRYQQFQDQANQGRGNREAYDALRADMQRVGQFQKSGNRQPVGAGAEEEEEEQ